MKDQLHPKYNHITVTCVTCNTAYEVNSTKKALHVDICSHCHPFYTGKMGASSKAGQIDKFNKRLKKQKN